MKSKMSKGSPIAGKTNKSKPGTPGDAYGRHGGKSPKAPSGTVGRTKVAKSEMTRKMPGC